MGFGFALLPAIVLSFLMSLVAIYKFQSEQLLPGNATTQNNMYGQTFVSYCNAVAAYQQANPTFIGTVSNNYLALQGSSFTPTFLNLAGNAITPTGSTGRVVTCYGTLPTGSINAALALTNYDVSYGIATGSTWTSTTSNIQTALATTVPNGAIVSVIQIGS